MPIRLALDAVEKSTFVIEASFTDADGTPVAPSAASWTLSDSAGAIVNARHQISFSPLGESVKAVLSGADLALAGDSDDCQRLITIEATYSSTLGSNLPLKEEALFRIQKLVGVS